MKKGKTRVFYGLNSEYSTVAVTCLGKQGEGYDEVEGMHLGREQVRSAIANGVRQLNDLGESEICVDPCRDPEAAAEGALLSQFVYDDLKAEKNKKKRSNVSCFTDFVADRTNVENQWKRGTILANGQTLAMKLMEMPSNKLTPQTFADIVTEKLTSQNCKVTVRDKNWIKSEKMGAFLSVAQGSQEPPLFVEIDYKGSNSQTEEDPIGLVGKGITFDTGGISIKPASKMDEMRADMGGAACVAGTLFAVSRLNLPVSIKAFIPLCENMPSGTAVKPGDVVTARNGKTIQVDNTDAEGRLILADALCYAETFKPRLLLDMATLTVTKSKLADINNIGNAGRSGGSCTAAAFLREFVSNKNWLHLDIAGVVMKKSEIPYLAKGMSGKCLSHIISTKRMNGRPTRTIVEFIDILNLNNCC
ncbi:hypothetical protein KUTeg_005308 [Tegillarca granosa]|uniref:Cytosol aminopeptidase n=1 Tax=Tegillarca granosa TaxID=220873 RepID=A0ABQ9FJF7_TEGGR|nr:hypothetical protein KUTeg_005308 [Tegillarca granosa]